jgi:hypothetical protein
VVNRKLLQKCYDFAVTISPNQKEFESLSVDRVRAYVLSSVWLEPKLSETRKWVSREVAALPVAQKTPHGRRGDCGGYSCGHP